MGWKTTGGGQKSLMLKNRSRERHMLRTLMVKENVVSFTLYFNAKFLVLIFAYVGDFIFFCSFIRRIRTNESLYYEIAVFLYCQIIHITLRWKSVKPLQIAEISFETSSFHNPRIFVYLHNFKWARMKLLSSCCLNF